MRWIFILPMLLIQAGEAAAQSAAPPPPPMRIAVVRAMGEACEPNCPEWIAADGDIVKGSASELRRVIQSLRGRKLPVILSSRGGDVDSGIAMGRMIREAGLSTAVGRTRTTPPCAPTDAACRRERRGKPLKGDMVFRGAQCASACAYVLAGGVERVVHPAAHVGVHQITRFITPRQVYRTWRVERRRINGRWVEVRRVLLSERVVTQATRKAEVTQASVDNIGRHFAAMGIDPELHAIASATPATTMRYLENDERLKLRIATTATNLLTVLGFDRQNPYFAEAGPQSGYIGYSTAIFEGRRMSLEYTADAARESAAAPLAIRLLDGQRVLPLEGLTLRLRTPDGVASEATSDAEHTTLRLALPRDRLCAITPAQSLVLEIGRERASREPDRLTRRAVETMPLAGIQGVLCPQHRWER
jgi:hypothetical protein